MTDVSILLVVRNWSTTRLDLSLESLTRALTSVDGEIVLLDYGSADSEVYRSLATKHGALYRREEAQVWSRSRALNAAASSASGQWLLFADADMLWTPNSILRCLEIVTQDENQALIFQARDLPSSFNEDYIAAHGYDWETLEQNSSWRPRWGMGMQMVPTHIFRRIQGLDERMVVYGAEDNDFASRLQRAGLRLHWIDDPDVRIYHIWHPSSREAALASDEGSNALRENRDILRNEDSLIRNLPQWANHPGGGDPLVSVVISTKDRREYLGESIDSVLSQTFQDFEILIMDDGDTDLVEDLVSSYEDPRIRYFKANAPGLAANRNRAAELSRGFYTAIHDDDDIMLPWSLEARLRALTGGVVGTYGGAFNFSNSTGELDLFRGKDFSLETITTTGKVLLHATILIETRVLRAVKYEETLRSGSDYNLAIRIALAGYMLKHCGEVLLLRRMHDRQVTSADSVIQKSSSHLTNAFTKLGQPATARREARKSALEVEHYDYPAALINHDRVTPWLPRHLIRLLTFVWASATDLPESSAEPFLKGKISDGMRETSFRVYQCLSPGDCRALAAEAEKHGATVTTGAVSAAIESPHHAAIQQALTTYEEAYEHEAPLGYALAAPTDQPQVTSVACRALSQLDRRSLGEYPTVLLSPSQAGKSLASITQLTEA